MILPPPPPPNTHKAVDREWMIRIPVWQQIAKTNSNHGYQRDLTGRTENRESTALWVKMEQEIVKRKRSLKNEQQRQESVWSRKEDYETEIQN